MRRSRLHKRHVWPLLAMLAVGLSVLAIGLAFHPQQTGFVGVLVGWLCSLVALIVTVIRAKRRAARGVIDMTREPDPAKGEFA